MERPDMWYWIWTEPGKAAVAGALGGLVRWITLRENYIDGIASLIVGAICATYLGPIAVPLVENTIGKLADSADPHGLSGLLVGLGGISLSGFLIDIFRARAAAMRGGEDGKPKG